MIKKSFFITIIILISIVCYGQNNQEKTNNIKPIVQVFGTASYDIENNIYGYSFARAHLGFEYQFNEKWKSKIIVDRGRATSVGEIIVTDLNGNSMVAQNSSTEGAYYTMFLKFASLQWKVNDRFSLGGGAILQNHYITQERFWGLRYVAQTFQDLYWHIPSSDLGFIANYKLNKVLSFDVAITNGEGPRKIQDVFGKVKFAGGMDINLSDKIQTRIYYHNRQSIMDNEKNEQLVSVFAGLTLSTKLKIGGEFNYIENLYYLEQLNSYGFSIFSTYKLVDKTELFARYDRLCNDNFTDNRNSLIGGISYSPVDGISISLNYQGCLQDEILNTNENNFLLSMEYKF